MTNSALNPVLDRFHPVTAEYSLANTTVAAPIAIMGVPFDNVTRAQTLTIIHRMVESRCSHYIATADMEFLVQAQTDVELRRILFDAHLVLCNGAPLAWASRRLGNQLAERATGADVVPLILEAAGIAGYRIFVLGGAEETNRKAAENIARQYPDAVIAGRYSPPPASLQNMNHGEIKRQIQKANPDIVLVAFGCPMQEKWISMTYRELGVPVVVGVGAAIDSLAGEVKRAPQWMRRTGLEWAWRMGQQPKGTVGRCMRNLNVFGKEIVRQMWNTKAPSQKSAGDRVKSLPLASDIQIVVMPPRLDAASVQESRRHWEVAATKGTVIVDLTATHFVDSTGVGFLMRLRRLAREKDSAFALAGVSAAVWRNIEMMKLGEFFPVGATVDHAWEIASESRVNVPRSEPTTEGIALHLRGELTEATATGTFECCAALINDAHSGQKVTVVLSQVTFLDSAGISVLVRLRKLVRAAGLELEFIKPTASVHNSLRMSGLATLLLNGGVCELA